MDWFQVVAVLALLINSFNGLSLKCGEDIVVRRGEKRVLRFWSSDDELLNVDVLPKTKESSAEGTVPLRPVSTGLKSGSTVTKTAQTASGATNDENFSVRSSLIDSTVEEVAEVYTVRTDLDSELEAPSQPDILPDLYYSYSQNIHSNISTVGISENKDEIIPAPQQANTNQPTIHNETGSSENETQSDVDSTENPAAGSQSSENKTDNMILGVSERVLPQGLEELEDDEPVTIMTEISSDLENPSDVYKNIIAEDDSNYTVDEESIVFPTKQEEATEVYEYHIGNVNIGDVENSYIGSIDYDEDEVESTTLQTQQKPHIQKTPEQQQPEQEPPSLTTGPDEDAIEPTTTLRTRQKPQHHQTPGLQQPEQNSPSPVAGEEEGITDETSTKELYIIDSTDFPYEDVAITEATTVFNLGNSRDDDMISPTELFIEANTEVVEEATTIVPFMTINEELTITRDNLTDSVTLPEDSETSTEKYNEEVTDNLFIMHEAAGLSEHKDGGMNLVPTVPKVDIPVQESTERLFIPDEPVTKLFQGDIILDSNRNALGDPTEQYVDNEDYASDSLELNLQDPMANVKIEMGEPLVSEPQLLRIDLASLEEVDDTGYFEDKHQDGVIETTSRGYETMVTDPIDIENEDGTTNKPSPSHTGDITQIKETSVEIQKQAEYEQINKDPQDDKHTQVTTSGHGINQQDQESILKLDNEHAITDRNLEQSVTKEPKEEIDILTEVPHENTTERDSDIQESTTFISIDEQITTTMQTNGNGESTSGIKEFATYSPTESTQNEEQITKVIPNFNTDVVSTDGDDESQVNSNPATIIPITDIASESGSNGGDAPSGSFLHTTLAADDNKSSIAKDSEKKVDQNENRNEILISSISSINGNNDEQTSGAPDINDQTSSTVSNEPASSSGSSNNAQPVDGDEETTTNAGNYDPDDSPTVQPSINETENDIFASIIDRWTQALEDLPDVDHVPVNELVIDVSEFLDIPSIFPQLLTDENFNKSSAELPVEHRDKLSPNNTGATGSESLEVTTQSSFSDQPLKQQSFPMAGFIDMSYTLDPQENMYTTQDPTMIYTEETTEIPTEMPRQETEIPLYEYPNLANEDDFKGYDYYEDLVDSLDVKEQPYNDKVNIGTTVDTLLIKELPEATTVLVQDVQVPDFKYPDLEIDSSMPFTTMTPLDENSMEEIETIATKLDIMSLRRDQLVDTGSKDDLITTDPEIVTMASATFPAFDVTMEETNGGDISTTAFSVPLLILQNQSVLNNLINGHGMKDGGKVVIKEQGSKVAITSPVRNVIYIPHVLGNENADPTTIKATSADSHKDIVQEQVTTQNPDTHDLTEHADGTEQTTGNTSTKMPPSTVPPTTKDPVQGEKQETTEYTTLYPSSEDETIAPMNMPSSQVKDVNIGAEKNAQLSEEGEDSYNDNEDVIRNSAATDKPDTTIDEATMPFWNVMALNTKDDGSLTEISVSADSHHDSGAHTALSFDEDIGMKADSIAVMSSKENVEQTQIVPTLDSDTQTLEKEKEDLDVTTVTDQFIDDSQVTDDYNGTTTVSIVTERTSESPELATIIIPFSFVDGLRSADDDSKQVSDRKVVDTDEAQLGEIHSPQVSGGVSRKDDEGQTDYGGDSPFFIRLPGSPNAIPVYIQYEPVEIQYVPEDGEEVDIENERPDEVKTGIDLKIQNLFRDELYNIVNSSSVDYENATEVMENTTDLVPSPMSDIQGETGPLTNTSQYTRTETDVTANDAQDTHSLNSGSLLDGIYRILDDVASAMNNQYHEQPISDKKDTTNSFRPNKPIMKRPDPFFVMEAPKLGNSEEGQQETFSEPSENEVQASVKGHPSVNGYTVDVSGHYGFVGSEAGKPGTVEDVPLRGSQEILYPGNYYLHESYTGVNLSSLVNPVFNLGILGTTIATQSPEDLLSPQYTPFPITTNPPRIKANASPLAALPFFTSMPSASANSLDSNKDSANDTETVSEIPAASEGVSTTEGPSSTSSKILPSIAYSPIPAVDFDASFDPSYIPDYIFGNEESIVAPYPNAFAGYSENYEDSNLIMGVPSGSMINDEKDLAKNMTASGADALPSEPFIAHEQVYAFPQSRQDPGHLGGHGPNKLNDEGPGKEYSAFYSAGDVPGIDPAVFSSRQVPPPSNDVPTAGKHGLFDSDTTDSKVNLEVDVEYDQKSPFPIPPSTREETEALLPNPVYFGPESYQHLPLALLHIFDPSIPTQGERRKRSVPGGENQIFCEWNIKTEPGLYLLMTFHNLSAAYTVDCHGAYIEVERENNGYDARWCGNRVGQAGTRPHVIFAKTEVRITVYDDGSGDKSFPTGFEADIEVIDLFNTRDYSAFMRSNAYPHIRRLILG